ncbi:3-oxoadipate enol-lactonase [Hoeflea sp. WL0058]|uniref:3-oxoadipate enol-lactonase n=1 Tax=Flavimaribacter sediminis TaxID=2865987 RepID=A0AAE3D4A4_9HYPH|nr:3-oxoadipate enol-lactonase [Flavimaribacter sediminis]MBW8640628.1 3-oxoadipate enol-lactonase [Flavimaribacter sediminis]
MQFARINGVTIHFQLIGAPEGRPVIVFSNSLGTDFRIWRDVIMRMAGEFAIVAYDKRGHGLSDVVQSPYSIDDHVGDLKGLLDLLGVTNAFICGLSVGGVIAQGLYARRPDLVRALILCDTAPKIGNADLWNGRIEAIEKAGIASISDAILERWFTRKFREEQTDEFAGYRNMLVRTPQEGYVGTCAALRDADLTAEAEKISVPTICIVGEEDGSTPPDLVGAMAKLIPDAMYQPIPNAGHLPCIEQPIVLAEAIKAFVDEVKRREESAG